MLYKKYHFYIFTNLINNSVDETLGLKLPYSTNMFNTMPETINEYIVIVHCV